VASQFTRFGICLAALCSSPALADEGGVSFWLPGQVGSLAAAPQAPGWQIATTYYHTSVKASGDTVAAKEISIGRFSPTLKVDLHVDLKARPDLEFLSASYVKSYYKWNAQRRPEGWNTWLTFAITPSAEPPPPAATAPMNAGSSAHACGLSRLSAALSSGGEVLGGHTRDELP
jgi:hypothetical protein